MEETQNTQPAEKPATPATDTPAQPATGDEQQAFVQNTVTLEVTLNGETKASSVRFHTPTILRKVREIDDAATVKVITDDKDRRVLLEGTKPQAVVALEASTIPASKVREHIGKLVNVIADHSDLRAISVTFVCVDEAGNDSGGGFVATTPECTANEAMELVNCSDANTDKFVKKIELVVPGRTERTKDGIVTPTPEQVKELG